mgnify:CR=1 FL=1
MKKSFQKTANDTLVNAVARILIIPLGFIQLPILTKNLSAQEYGIWGLIFTTCSLALPLTSLGLGPAMSRFLPAERIKENIQEGFYSVLFLRMFISVFVAMTVLVFASDISVNFFDGYTDIVKITAVFIILKTLTPIYKRLLKIWRKIKFLSFISIFDGYASVILYSILIYSGYGLLSIVQSALVMNLILILLLIIYVRPQIGFRLPNFSLIKQYLKFGLPTLPASMSYWVVNLTDRYIIAFYLGTASVGVYSAAYFLGRIPLVFSATINFIMMVAISKLYDDGRIDEVKTHLSYGLKYFLALSIPYTVATFAISDNVLLALTTAEIADRGSPIIPVVALAHLFLGIYNLLTYILLLTKKTKKIAILWTLSLPLNLGLNILIVPSFGIFGAALTTLIAYFIAMCGVIYFALKELQFNSNWDFIIKSILASTLMFVVIWNINPVGNFQLILTIIGCVFIYGISLISLRGFSTEEYGFFKALLIKAKVKT